MTKSTITMWYSIAFAVLLAVASLPLGSVIAAQDVSLTTRRFQADELCFEPEALANEWMATAAGTLDATTPEDFVATDYAGTWNGAAFNGLDAYISLLLENFGTYEVIDVEAQTTSTAFVLALIGILPPSENQAPDVEHLVALNIDVSAMCDDVSDIMLDVTYDEDNKQCQEDSPFRAAEFEGEIIATTERGEPLLLMADDSNDDTVLLSSEMDSDTLENSLDCAPLDTPIDNPNAVRYTHVPVSALPSLLTPANVIRYSHTGRIFAHEVELVELRYDHMGNQTKLTLCLRGTIGAEVNCTIDGPGVIGDTTMFRVGLGVKGEAKLEMMINRYGYYNVYCSDPRDRFNSRSMSVNVTSDDYSAAE